MKPNKFVAYQETQLLTASAGTLARIALDESMKATRVAISNLNSGNSMERSRAVTKAINLLTEFTARLNDQESPETCLNLRRVCDYSQRRLMEAHFKRSETMMTEVIGLLQPIVEAWMIVERRAAVS